MVVQFKRLVEYREDVIAYVQMNFKDDDIPYIERKLKELEFNNIINLGEDYEKRFAYIYFSDVKDSDYADMYLGEFASSLMDVCEFGKPILLEKKMYRSLTHYILESIEEITDYKYETVASIDCVFEDTRDPAVVSSETITAIEDAISYTSNPQIYNYDIKHIGSRWTVNFWVLRCDVSDINEQEYFEELINKLPVTWQIK